VSDDLVGLRGLRVECVIGVNPDERTRTQPLLVDVELRTDVREAAATDDVARTVDYTRVADEIRGVLVAGAFWTLEAAAEAVAVRCLARPRVRSVRVRLDKPDALGGAAVPWVQVDRSPNDAPTG
jgi:dihydroneopterin aldolase